MENRQYPEGIGTTLGLGSQVAVMGIKPETAPQGFEPQPETQAPGGGILGLRPGYQDIQGTTIPVRASSANPSSLFVRLAEKAAPQSALQNFHNQTRIAVNRALGNMANEAAQPTLEGLQDARLAGPPSSGAPVTGGVFEIKPNEFGGFDLLQDGKIIRTSTHSAPLEQFIRSVGGTNAGNAPSSEAAFVPNGYLKDMLGDIFSSPDKLQSALADQIIENPTSRNALMNAIANNPALKNMGMETDDLHGWVQAMLDNYAKGKDQPFPQKAVDQIFSAISPEDLARLKNTAQPVTPAATPNTEFQQTVPADKAAEIDNQAQIDQMRMLMNEAGLSRPPLPQARTFGETAANIRAAAEPFLRKVNDLTGGKYNQLRDTIDKLENQIDQNPGDRTAAANLSQARMQLKALLDANGSKFADPTALSRADKAWEQARDMQTMQGLIDNATEHIQLGDEGAIDAQKLLDGFNSIGSQRVLNALGGNVEHYGNISELLNLLANDPAKTAKLSGITKGLLGTAAVEGATLGSVYAHSFLPAGVVTAATVGSAVGSKILGSILTNPASTRILLSGLKAGLPDSVITGMLKASVAANNRNQR